MKKSNSSNPTRWKVRRANARPQAIVNACTASITEAAAIEHFLQTLLFHNSRKTAGGQNMQINSDGYLIFESMFDISRKPSDMTDAELKYLAFTLHDVATIYPSKGITSHTYQRHAIEQFFGDMTVELARRFISKMPLYVQAAFVSPEGKDAQSVALLQRCAKYLTPARHKVSRGAARESTEKALGNL